MHNAQAPVDQAAASNELPATSTARAADRLAQRLCLAVDSRSADD